MAQVAVAVAHRNGPAVIARWSVALKTGELFGSRVFSESRRGNRPRGRLVLMADEFSLCANGLTTDRLGFDCGSNRGGYDYRLTGLLGLTAGDHVRFGLLFLSITGHERQPHPTEDVVDDAFGDSDIWIGGMAIGFEASMAELVDQNFQWNTVLKR